MRHPKTTWSLCLVLLALAHGALGQSQNTENTLKLDDPATRPEASIEDLAWLVGTWRGEGLGGTVEEVWTAPTADTMMGVFKAARDGEVQFYEILILVQEEGSLTLKLKHFHPDLKGWEEKDEVVEFPLVAIKEREALFSGLTYRRTKDDALHAFVATSREGRMGELKLVLRRVGGEG